MNWFDVDKEGLAKLIASRGKVFVLYELLQNAWDESVTKVIVTLAKEKGARCAVLEVEDDSPEGFKNLSHAFTLFAESEKKGDAEKRGRFNFGEKMVLAMCFEAAIYSTKGSVLFDYRGRHSSPHRRNRGTLFRARIPMTNAELAACHAGMAKLIPNPRCETIYNGEVLKGPKLAAWAEAALPTVIAHEDGVLVPTTRKTMINIYIPSDGEPGMLYEMGIPVVETGDAFHVDVQQKVPLGFNRDNVTPGYLRIIRAKVLEQTSLMLDQHETADPWVRDAMTHPSIDVKAVRQIVERRFGDKVVSYDPSDPEANKIAITRGYKVIHGGQMTKPEWDNIRRAEAILPAGRVTPSPRPYHPDGAPLKLIPREQWTAIQVAFAINTKVLARALLQKEIDIRLAADYDWPFAATYGGCLLTINVSRVSSDFFDGYTEESLGLLLHEFGHEYASDHLSEEYYNALTTLGARLALFARKNGWNEWA